MAAKGATVPKNEPQLVQPTSENKQQAKKPFVAPVLRRFGTIAQLTKGFAGTGGDNMPSVGMTRP